MNSTQYREVSNNIHVAVKFGYNLCTAVLLKVQYVVLENFEDEIDLRKVQ